MEGRGISLEGDYYSVSGRWSGRGLDVALGHSQFPKGGGPYDQSATSKSASGRVESNTNLLN